jgi:hypothetical protein
MLSSRMLLRLALVRTDVSEERIAFIIRVKIVGELGMLAVTSNRSMLLTDSCHPDDSGYMFSRNATYLKATRRNIPEDIILQSHSRGILKSYMAITG